jgi:hypothetical protein
MFFKIKEIITYYDSEPTEVTQSFIWLVVYPILYTSEHGFNILLVLFSVALGLSSLYSTCYHNLKTRKIMALGVFLFSVIASTMYFIHGGYKCPTSWLWVLISISALFNLRRICNHYYQKLNKDG